MDVNIPHPNEGLAEWFMGPENRRIMDEIATKAALLAQAEIHKRTGALSASVNANVDIGGHHNDRYVADVTIGGTVDYGASYEFGTSKGNEAHHVADAVLGQLGEY
jgi:hypothetical protein